jgi:hypothetical protein
VSEHHGASEQRNPGRHRSALVPTEFTAVMQTKEEKENRWKGGGGGGGEDRF